MEFFETKSGGGILLNLSDEHCTAEGSNELTIDIQASIDRLTSIPPNRQILVEYIEAMDHIFDETICISPYTIFRVPLHRDICRKFNEQSRFGTELRDSLEDAGAFDFLSTVSDRGVSQGIIERILAVFTMSTAGLETVDEAPIQYVHSVVDFFRSEDGMAWNEDILGSGDVTKQCVSNVVNGLSKVFNDPRLVHKARKHRKARVGGNIGWQEFTNSADALDQDLFIGYTDFLSETRIRPANLQAAVLSISAWIKSVFPGHSLSQVLHSADRPTIFADFLVAKNGGVANKNMTVTVANAKGFTAALAAKFSTTVVDPDATKGAFTAEISTFELVSQRDVNWIKSLVGKITKPSSTRSRPLPERLIPLMKEILDEGEHGWPGRTFRVTINTCGKLEKRYCPVIPSLFRAMSEVPLRMGQIRRLDSGEGDVRVFNGHTMEWCDNHGPLAGYWADLEGHPRADFPTRGYAIDIPDVIKNVTGLWVNSNKTGEPFAMPWTIPVLLKLFWELRTWQETYNPITAPIGPELYLDSPDRYPDATKAEMPSIFPLARVLGKRWPLGKVVSASQLDHAWCELLLEIEKRWNEMHPGNQSRLVSSHPTNNQPYKPKYNIHGMRVRGLTNLSRGGMPPQLLSKFVAGHATVRQTIYYIEPLPSEIEAMLQNAATRSSAQRRFIDDLKDLDVEEALRRSVSLSGTALPEAIAAGAQFEFCNVAIGVCPYDGSRCWDGGELLRKDDSDGPAKSTYGKVEDRNCAVCRHFISGPPWLTELEAFGTKLSERRQHLAREETKIRELATRYEKAKSDNQISLHEFENKWDDLGVDLQKIKNEQESVENTMFNVELYINASVRLIEANRTKSPSLQLVSNARSSHATYQETSEFRQAAIIVAAGKAHKILGDERVQAKMNRYCDLMMFNSDIAPAHLMTNVTPYHRQESLNQFSQFVALRASDAEIEGLIDGSVVFKDLGLEDEARKLIEVSLSDPVLTLGGSPFISNQAGMSAV